MSLNFFSENPLEIKSNYGINISDIKDGGPYLKSETMEYVQKH